MTWAEAVGPDGHVTALEFSQAYADTAAAALKEHNVPNVSILVGDARESIKTLFSTLSEPFDLVFIDADKTSYPTYLSLILELSPKGEGKRLLRKGGVVVADNILRRGLIADSSAANPWSPLAEGGREKQADGGRMWRDDDMRALDAFNKAMVESERIDTFLMPMFDGLGMGRLVD